MILIRKSLERGHFDHGWLDTFHTFSFGDYDDPEFRGFRSLRVLNEDRVAPGTGFPMHGHRDMEIITYVLEGTLEHRDSMGNGSLVRAGDLQRMTAGTGVRHSEFNPSPSEPVHLYQIWLLPSRRGLEPSYEQRSFPNDETRGRFRVVASPEGGDGTLRIQQDATLSLATLEPGQSITQNLRAGRHAWLQVLQGSIDLNQHAMAAGDGAAIRDEPALNLQAVEPSQVLLFDLV